MSRNSNQQPVYRDYGATSSSTNAITEIPDVLVSGFSPTEFMSLSENIGNNMNAVKEIWTTLDRKLKYLDKNEVTQSIYNETMKIEQEANLKIQTTTTDLQRLSAIVRRGDKKQKLQFEKLTTEFGIYVQKYSDSQKKISAKLTQFYQKQMANEQDDTISAANSAEANETEDLQQQQILARNLEFQKEVLTQRNERIQNIEKNVLDINVTMRILSNMVQQQRENIDTVENNIDFSAAAVEAGAVELQKAAEYRTRYRKKILILLVIAVIIGLIVTGIIVSKIKS